MGAHGSYDKHTKDRLCAKRYSKVLNKLDDLTRFGSNKEVFDKWVEISTTQQSEDTIRNALLDDPYSVCLSFLLHYQTFSEDFIEELYWLSTKIFNHRNYSKRIIKLLIEFTDDIPRDERMNVLIKIRDGKDLYGKEVKYTVLSNFNLGGLSLVETLIDKLDNDRGPDRLDWSELNNWDLSKKFREKYQTEFENIKFIVDNSYDEDSSYLSSSSANLY